MSFSNPCRTIRLGLALSLASLLQACLPSEHAQLAPADGDIERWLDECADERNDFVVRERFCTLALRSDELYEDEVYDALYWLASAYYDIGDFESAIAAYSDAIDVGPDIADGYEARGHAFFEAGYDLDAREDYLTALELSGAPHLERYVREIDEAAWQRAEAQRDFALTYEGLWCGAIQKDSVLDPPNEILLQAIAYGASGAQGVDLPRPGGVYGGVRPGFATSRGRTDVWIGRAEPLTLSVVMWEHDDGGPVVDLAAYAAVEIAMSRVMPPMPMGAPPAGEGFSPGLVDGAVGNVAKGILGTANDAMGTHHHHFDPRDYAGQPLRQAHGIGHHFATSHRRGGADCRAYFSVRAV